jgi:hypothetical protein
MEQHAKRKFPRAEVFVYAVNDKRAIRHRTLDDDAIMVGRASDLYRLGARVEEVESVFSNDSASRGGKELSRIGRQPCE